jgi:DNA invertase Pin-like site-specific DNA recombinase
LDALLKGVARREFDVVAAWSVCRLGLSLPDLISFLGELQARDVDLFRHQQAIDTGTPSGRALFGMLGVFAECASVLRWTRDAVSGRRRRC